MNNLQNRILRMPKPSASFKMLKNHYQNTKEYNNRKLENLSGIRFYYSKIKIGASIIVLSLFVLFFALLTYTENFGEGLILFIVVIEVLFLYALYGLLAMFFLKQPIFILDTTKLYYLKTNTWYDLDTHIFENKLGGRYNYYLTFCVKDKKGKELLTENNWFLNDEDRLLSAIRYLKIHQAKNTSNY